VEKYQLKRKCLAVGIILLFIGVTITPLDAQDASKSYASASSSGTHDGEQNGTSFTVNISGPTFWMVIKLMFPPNTYINIWQNETMSNNHSGYGYSMFMYTPSDLQWVLFGGVSTFIWSEPEVYCRIGALNWSIAHNSSQDVTDWATGHFHGVLPWWINQSWYLIFVSYATNNSLTVQINTNRSGSIAVERGDTVFALDRDDFLDGINVGWRRGICMVNTQKNLEIKHRFIGWFGTVALNSFELLSYQMPNGTAQRLFGLHFLGHTKDDIMWLWGPSGTWQFHATMMSIALLPLVPRVYLFGADVALPS
jgi:hypothetical protein